eukprot:g1451.t1
MDEEESGQKRVTKPFERALILSENEGCKVYKYDDSVWDMWAEKIPERMTESKSDEANAAPFALEFVKLRQSNEGGQETSRQKDAFVEDAMRWRYLATMQRPKSEKPSAPPSPTGFSLKKKLPPLGLETPFSESPTESEDPKRASLSSNDIAVLTGHEGRVMNTIWDLANPRGSLAETILRRINSMSRKQRKRPMGKFHLIDALRSLMQKHLLKQTSVVSVVRVSKTKRTLNIYGSRILKTRGAQSDVVLRETSILIPDRFDLVPSLRSLALKECTLYHVPSSVSSLRMLKSLSLSNNSLETVPAAVFDMCVSLESLVLNDNRISVLPSVERLSRLRLLWLSSNRLRSLPHGVESLSHLSDICVNDNLLETLPKDVGNLVQLRRLSAAGNSIRSIPSSVAGLQNLEHLDLQRNRLSGKLPEELSELRHLRTLLLAHNELTAVHESVGCMTSLKDLVLTDNRLNGMPESILMLTQLTEIQLLQNPLEEPKEGSVWKLSESTEIIAKEKIDRSVAKRSSMALTADAFVKACGLKAGSD